MTRWPALVVTNGPDAGQVHTVRTEHAVVGRGADADVSLRSGTVSGRHVGLTRHGADLLVQDLGSSNGTYVNDRRLDGVSLLRPGDRLVLGDVVLEYVVLGGTGATAAGPAGPARSYDFGDVQGPVNTGNPVNHSGNQVVGEGSIYHGEYVHHGDRFDVDTDPSGVQELFSGRGPGRLLMAVGLVVAIAGFAIWMSVIFSGFTYEPGSGGPSPFEKQVLGFNAPVVGFAMFAGGGLLAQLGAGMSKAARRRQERRHR
jgi:hypothetical protein